MATCGVSLDDGNIAKTTVDEMFDEIVMNAPDVMFDCRAYYWPNFHSPSYIMHGFSKFTFAFTLPTISSRFLLCGYFWRTSTIDHKST